MKIIISPAKKMKEQTDMFIAARKPVFLEDACRLMQKIRRMSLSEAQELWRCNDQLALLNYERFQQMDLLHALTPAIFAYEGLQYQHMAPDVFTDDAMTYIASHLRILSGFYGVLSPFDGVTPYRLEMQAKLAVDGSKDLYGFWNRRLYEKIVDKDRTILNLASKEYAMCVEKYITSEDRFITMIFAIQEGGKIKQKGTLAKMARGEFVRFMAENQITDPEQAKDFHELGFTYCPERSERDKFVFLV